LAEVNIILNILETLKAAKPDAVFINSLHHQYCNRGGLSKKQLEGLHSKATASGIISVSKLATLEAIIKKKPNRYKSEIVIKAPEPTAIDVYAPLLASILEKYPQHKMALFLQSKCAHNDVLSETEKSEINRLAKVLLK
jgi:hypothetical protein